VTHGFTAPDAALHAEAQLARIIQQQAAFLGFLDWFLAAGLRLLDSERLWFSSRARSGRLVLAPHIRADP